ncbi:hypothetical protein QE152_g13381 [Popillia japonica]|uniref:PiggyBac transposable element-derived protein domain-containing protein n=1 Tax=Popillia japonica TaxID=7064 RepID=A0AAW1LDW6_POPJA
MKFRKIIAEPMVNDGWCNLSDSDDDDDENEVPKDHCENLSDGGKTDTDNEIVENEVFDGGKSDSNDIGDDENGDSNVSIPNKRHKVTYNASFKWRKHDLHPILHDFDNNNSDCNIPNMEENPSILEIFGMFITRDFVENIVNETNRYYNFVYNKNPTVGNMDTEYGKTWISSTPTTL